jgi:glycosyltransferase involved in cell wall biosynthesis
MTIYLAPEVRSGLGEDTFWEWSFREFPSATFSHPPVNLPAGDVLLQYSTLGVPNAFGNTVALLWELHPEMRLQLGGNDWDDVIARTERCAADCRRRVISTRFAAEHYRRFGKVDLLPIGVDAELFKPMPGQQESLRAKYNIPDGRVGFWMGTNHPMKGFDRLRDYARENPDVHWIIVHKTRGERGRFPPANSTEFTHIPQAQLAELMNCADFFLACGRLRPWFMVEWEAMACNLPFIDISGLEREFPLSSNPREELLLHGWDRESAKKQWLEYLAG